MRLLFSARPLALLAVAAVAVVTVAASRTVGQDKAPIVTVYMSPT